MAYKKFFYEERLRNYIVQFMAVFTGLNVKVGANDRIDEPHLIPVPVNYGHKDRVVGHIIGKHTQNAMLRLPVMSAYMRNLALAPQDRHGVAGIQRQQYMPRGGFVPEDLQTQYNYMPIPYRMQMELAIYTSNTDQMMQLLEQILPLFDPTIDLQISDDILDYTRITSMELTDINSEDNYPIGTDRRIKITTLGFDVRIYLGVPKVLKENFIKDIYLRIGAVSNSANTPDEMLADLDLQGYQHEKIFSLDDVNLFGEKDQDAFDIVQDKEPVREGRVRKPKKDGEC